MLQILNNYVVSIKYLKKEYLQKNVFDVYNNSMNQCSRLLTLYYHFPTKQNIYIYLISILSFYEWRPIFDSVYP